MSIERFKPEIWSAVLLKAKERKLLAGFLGGIAWLVFGR